MERITLKKNAINPIPTMAIILRFRMSPLPDAASVIKIIPRTVIAAMRIEHWGSYNV